MSLAETLNQTVDAVRSAVPLAIFTKIGDSITDLAASGQAQRAAHVGTRIEWPVLQSLDGAPLDLNAATGRRGTVLTFYRGGWCPYCNVALRALAAARSDLEEAGGAIVAVTPELPQHADATAARAEAGFTVAVDRHNTFARSLGLVFSLPADLRPLYKQIGIDLEATNGDDSHTLPLAATYVIDRNAIIRWAFVDADFTKRAEPDDILAALKTLD